MNELIQIAPALIEVSTKKEIEQLSKFLVDEILSNGKCLELAERIAATETLIKSMKADKRYVEYVREELAKYKGKYESNGTKIEAVETGTRYSFDGCNDQHLNDMLKEFEELETVINERKEMLKRIPASGLVVTDPGTAETYTCYPPSKVSNSSYKVTLASK